MSTPPGTPRPVSGRWFEDLPVGTTVEHVTRRTATETDNVLFTTMTMNPRHCTWTPTTPPEPSSASHS